MAKIKSSGTSPERILIKALRSKGYKISTSNNKLPGNPDIILARKKIAVFVDGEFWHGYHWKMKKKRIKKNRKYWINKIENNIKRDRKCNAQLKKAGWKILRFWQHDIEKDLKKCIKTIRCQ